MFIGDVAEVYVITWSRKSHEVCKISHLFSSFTESELSLKKMAGGMSCNMSYSTMPLTNSSAGCLQKDHGSNGFPGVAGTLVLSMVILVTYCAAEALQGRRKLPPGPRPWPILGNLLAFRGDFRHKVLQKLATKFGGLMYITLGCQRCIVVSTAAVAKEVFQTSDKIFLARPKTYNFEIIADNFIDWITAVKTQEWQQIRKFCINGLFSSAQLTSQQGMRAEEVHHVMKCIAEDCKKGKPIPINDWAFQVALNVVTQVLTKTRYYKNGMHEQDDEVHVMLAGLGKMADDFIVSDFFPSLRFDRKLQGWEAYLREYRRSMAIVAEKVFDIQNHINRQAALAKHESTAPSQLPFQPDFLDELLAAKFQDGKPFPAELLALNLLEGGTESLSNSTEWAMTEIMRRPDVLKQLQAELDAVVGSYSHLVQEAHIANLPFLQAVVKETMRLYPAIPLVPRESHEPCQILGYTIPANTRLILNLYAIQRDRSVYTNPDKFDPTRFLDNHQAAFNNYELIPFGRGRRMCPAFSYATTMVSFLVANLVHSFDWTLPHGETPDNLDMSEDYGLAVNRRRCPLVLNGKLRSPASLY